jgi:hypothetical protein
VNARAVGAILGAATLTLAACGLGTKGPILWEPVSEGGVGVVVLKGQSTAQEGGDGGEPYVDTCPAGEVVIGYRGEVLPPDSGLIIVVSRIQALCGAIVLDGGASNQVSFTASSQLPERGMVAGPSWSDVCDADEVIVGFSGRSGQYVDQLAFQCAHWIISNGDGGPVLTMNGTTSLPAVGGEGGSPFPPAACPTGQMAIGNALRAGFWLDAFSLVCGTPALESGAAP